MKKRLLFGIFLILSLIVLNSCDHDEPNNNGNSETPENGGSDSINQEYPSTAVVIYNAVTDIDGNHYDAVQIGNQVWMAENLRTTRFPDGTPIPLGDNAFSYTVAFRYAPGQSQSNSENANNVAHYGYLYNWPAVVHDDDNLSIGNNDVPSGVQGICPDGWHLPSNAEWVQLISYLGTQPAYSVGEGFCSPKALAATWGWKSVDASSVPVPGYEPASNNATGFSALPAGMSVVSGDIFDSLMNAGGEYEDGAIYNEGIYSGFSEDANFWTVSNWWGNIQYYSIRYNGGMVFQENSILERCNGFSVRCLRD